jgi:uncharacterized protein (TIGR00369 family)
MSIDYGNLRFMAEPLTAPLSSEEQQKRRRAVRDLMLTTPFIGGLGIVFERYEPDDVTIRLPFREDLTNDGTYFHGGVIASVMDTAGAAAAWSNHDFDKGMRASTVAMSIQNRIGVTVSGVGRVKTAERQRFPLRRRDR